MVVVDKQARDAQGAPAVDAREEMLGTSEKSRSFPGGLKNFKLKVGIDDWLHPTPPSTSGLNCLYVRIY